ncbi:hypothetical protein NQ315_003103 [Exocentrus adspersus]|uniref:Separase n=1 Tax=Exocentrus adspersus TaxID=1586481 RepID=A0AAV8W656_9CUCU|nr:hypothetical protein NQ315_003103 [Exocentrus adspersus]
MDNKNALKTILDLCKQSRFKESTDKLRNVQEDIDIATCRVCYTNTSTPEAIPEEDLYRFLKLIVTRIKDVNETELLSYLQSLFHILKMFVNKERSQLISKLGSVLAPSFLPSTLPKKHKDTYQSSAILLYNFVVTSNETEGYDTLVEICSMVSEMYAVSSGASKMLGMSFKCASHLSQVSCPLEKQEDYFFKVLNLVGSSSVNAEEDFKTVLSHFTLVLQGIFKKFRFEQAVDFYRRGFECSAKLFESSDCVNALTLLRLALVLTPATYEDKLESLLKCKRSLANLTNASKKELVINKLHSLLYTVVCLYYKDDTDAGWCKQSEMCRLESLQLLWEVSRLELSAKYSCSCNCPLGSNVYQAFSYSQYVWTLIELCVREAEVSSNVHEEFTALLVKFSRDIKYLKANNCEKWKMAWNAFRMAVYNIGVYLYQKADKACLHYLYMLLKHFIRFEYLSSESGFKSSIISSAFIVLLSYVAGDYKKCMAMAALAMKLCPNERNSFVSNWIKAKASQRELKTSESDVTQRVTLASSFKRFKKEMNLLTDGTVSLTTEDKIDLLKFELEQYKSKWKSKIPMMSALKELHETADLTITVEVIVTIFGDCELMLHEDVPKMLQSILKRYEGATHNNTPQSTIFLAVLYFMHYKYCLKDTIGKNADDMERTMSVTAAQKPDEPPDAIPRDPNEECDIVSSYDSLKLNKYFGIMKYLNKSLSLFAAALASDFQLKDLSKVPVTLLYNLLLKISFEYRLHRFSVKLLHSLQLALKVAQLEDNACNIVWAIAFIIENADVQQDYVKRLILVADKQLEDIEDTSVDNLKVVLTYYVCKAKCLLYHDYKEAYRIFQMANELFHAQEDTSKLQLVKAQLHVLHFKFVLLPCQFRIVDHKKSTLLTIHQANAAVYEVYNTTKLDGSYEMSILLDTNEELVKLHYFLRCPREVRAYCRDTVILSQKLVLPLRCAYYLVYLAHADLRSSRYDDGRVKINGLADILCLSRHSFYPEQENEPPPCKEVLVQDDVESITSGVQEMVLDLPVPDYYRKQLSPSSPTLVIQPFHFPAFVYHESGCDCFYCISLEYQSLVLEKARLDALLNVKLNNVMISGDFYRSALNYYEHCFRKYQESYRKAVCNYITPDLIPDLVSELTGAYGFTLLEYSSHLRRTDYKAEAVKVTNKLIQLVVSRKLQHIYLYNDALMQKLGYLTELPVPAKVPEMESLCPEQNTASAKTPESKHNKVAVPVQCTPSFSPPKRRVKKCLPFNLSPNEDNEVANQLKTPAPKIKIYSKNDGTAQKCKGTTEGSKRNKKKAPVVDIPNLVVNTPVPVVCPVDNQPELRARTRLLTERLKQSTKKAETPVTNGDVENGRKAIRKNLFEDESVEKEASAPQGGAIRKTRRTRKAQGSNC